MNQVLNVTNIFICWIFILTSSVFICAGLVKKYSRDILKQRKDNCKKKSES